MNSKSKSEVSVIRTTCLVLAAWLTLIFFSYVGNRTFQSGQHSLIHDLSYAKMLAAIGPLLFFLVYVRIARHSVSYSKLKLPRWLLIACPIAFALASWVSREFVGPIDNHHAFKIAIACLCIGIAEESLFRGTIFLGLQGYRPVVYLFLSASLFAITHITFSPIAMLNVFVVGLAYGLARLSRISIVVLLLIHALHDAAFLMPNTQFNGWEQYAFWTATALTLGVTVAFLFLPDALKILPRKLKNTAIAG